MDRTETIAGGGLCLRFFQLKDRYRHEVCLVEKGEAIALLRSIEGSHADDWPASPPLQSVHLERRAPDRQVALAVGMAGKSHWSLAVELDPAAGALTFEVACRVRDAPPGALPSRHRLSSSYQLIFGEAACVALQANGSWRCHAPAFGASLEIAPMATPGAGAKLERAADRLILSPLDSDTASSKTICWSYRLNLKGDANLFRG